MSPWLEAICLKCLEKAPARRYASAQALADDLDRWQHKKRPRGPLHPLARLGRRLPWVAVGMLLTLSMLWAVEVYRAHRPELALQRAQERLSQGLPVTLIGATGRPAWYRWQAGGPDSHAFPARDHTFAVQSSNVGLLELLPDPQTTRYHFSAEIRHDSSDKAGEVGLYYNHGTPVEGLPPVQFFLRTSFNAVRGDEEYRAIMPREFLQKVPFHENTVHNVAHWLKDGPTRSRFDRTYGAPAGPRFRALGEDNGRWHRLELDVTPQGVTARWNGQPWTWTAAAAEKSLDEVLKMWPESRLPRGYRPTFGGGRGLGLYIQRGSASFRNVTVTPPGSPPRRLHHTEENSPMSLQIKYPTPDKPVPIGSHGLVVASGRVGMDPSEPIDAVLGVCTPLPRGIGDDIPGRTVAFYPTKQPGKRIMRWMIAFHLAAGKYELTVTGLSASGDKETRSKKFSVEASAPSSAPVQGATPPQESQPKLPRAVHVTSPAASGDHISRDDFIPYGDLIGQDLSVVSLTQTDGPNSPKGVPYLSVFSDSQNLQFWCAEFPSLDDTAGVKYALHVEDTGNNPDDRTDLIADATL